jgi:hypothetical protein
LLILAIFVVVALQFIWLFLVLNLNFGEKPLKADMASRGQFGDLFGGVNALFTGLAFAGLLFTIALQRYDLKIQRAALEDQAELLQESTRLSVMATLADIYTRQIDVMERENFLRHLWKAECGIHTLAKEAFPGNKKATESFMKTDYYINLMEDVAPYITFPDPYEAPVAPELRDEEATERGMKNPLFRTSYEKWLHYHRELDRLSLELEQLEGNLKEAKERQVQAPPEST